MNQIANRSGFPKTKLQISDQEKKIADQEREKETSEYLINQDEERIGGEGSLSGIWEIFE